MGVRVGKLRVNFFNSLRASTETDLMDEHGLRRACQWAGNSAATAMKNYALVRKSDSQGRGHHNQHCGGLYTGWQSLSCDHIAFHF